MSGFTGNSRGIRIVVLIVLGLLAAGALGLCSTADAREPEGLSIGFGPVFAGSERCFTGMMVAQELDHWILNLQTHGDSTACREPPEPITANIGIGVVRFTGLGKWKLGIGASVWEHGDVVVGDFSGMPASSNTVDITQLSGSVKTLGTAAQEPRRAQGIHLCGQFLFRRPLGKRLVLDVVHCSSGGSTHYNRGRNFLMFSAAF